MIYLFLFYVAHWVCIITVESIAELLIAILYGNIFEFFMNLIIILYNIYTHIHNNHSK